MTEDALGMGLAFAKHKRRIEEAFQQKLDAAAKTHELEIGRLKAQLASIETSSDKTPMEYARLKEENETLKLNLSTNCGEARAREVLELLHATRERNAIDQELRNVKKNGTLVCNDPLPIQPSERNARSRRFVSHHTINRIRKQAVMQKELADMEKRMLQKNDENEHLRGKIAKLEAQLCNDTLIEPNVEPKWVKYQKLYYSLLVCDPSGNPVTNSNGDFIPVHGKHSFSGVCLLRAVPTDKSFLLQVPWHRLNRHSAHRLERTLDGIEQPIRIHEPDRAGQRLYKAAIKQVRAHGAGAAPFNKICEPQSPARVR